MSIALVACETVSHFLKFVMSLREKWFDSDDPWGPIFRGQRKASWTLCPSLYREYGSLKSLQRDFIEDEIREEFAVRAPALSDSIIPQDPWGLYFLMQHYGAATRLLDWTEGALIALYFAVRDNLGLCDAAVWVLDPYRLNKKVIGFEEIYAPNEPNAPEVQTKRVARWLPDRFSKSRLPKTPVAVYSTHAARRISTQRACFTVHGSDPAGLDKLQGGCLAKAVIPGFRTHNIKRELELAGVDETTIFPDLDGLGRTICNRWRIDARSLPHEHVYTRLKPSDIHGVGVFAIRDIPKGTDLFREGDDEMLWVRVPAFRRLHPALRKLYEDFAVLKGDNYGCPRSFNRLTMSWYLNEPAKGQFPNVICDEITYDFRTARNISAGEELTVDYSSFSDNPKTNGHSGTEKLPCG